MGVKIEELKTIKGGGGQHEEKRKIGEWSRSKESRRDGVGTGSHEDQNREPLIPMQGPNTFESSIRNIRYCPLQVKVYDLIHYLPCQLYNVAILTSTYRSFLVVFLIIYNICIMQLSFCSFTQNYSYFPLRVVNIERNSLD